MQATNNKNKTVLSFYSMPEYEAWKESLGGNANGWSIKYYKGLGTSKSEEGKEYFKAIDKHKKDFVWVDEQDGDAIELAFSKKKIEARKNWLRQFEPENYLDQKQKHIKYSDFINKELILFSRADLQRSIPSMVDGLKPGQRKILFCAFKRNFVKQAKVAQFVGYVSEKSAYHHGEQSLATTIIGMAQDFVGSNNINLLLPEGQFGTRHQGGKDHASARYIFTCLSPITRFLFPKNDDILLDYLNEDGQSIEPTWYMPVIPMVLVNGSEGIGTGWSSFIPNYNPKDIVANVRRLLNDEPMQPMHPWYRGFKGRIEQSATKEAGVTYTITGIAEEVDDTTLKITELPVRRWTQDYKEFLESIMTGNDKIKEPFIKDYREYNDDKTVHFEVALTEESMNIALQEGLEKKFKLTTTISTTNMHLFDPKGAIKKYDTPEQILEEFFHLRYEFYERRKKALLDNLEFDLLKLDNKVRFILGVVRGEIIVNNRKRVDLFHELQEKGFTPMPKKTKGIDAAVAGAADEEEEQEEVSPQMEKGLVKASDYEYLMSMPIGTLTLEKVQELCADKDRLQDEVAELRRTSPRSLWLKELDALEQEIDKLEKRDAEAEKNNVAHVVPSRQAPKKPRKTAANNNSSAAGTEGVKSEAAQKKANGGSKRAPVKKPAAAESDEDNDILELKDRLAAYNLDSSPEQTAMETGLVVDQEGQKKQTARNATSKKATSAVPSVEDDDAEMNRPTAEEDDDEDFSLVQAAPKVGKGRGRKPAAAKAKVTTTRKRGPAQKSKLPVLGQKLITDVLKPAEDGGKVSPMQKVRKMRASPFNKKSGSVLGRLKSSPSGSEDSGGSPSGINEEVAFANTRPKREQKSKAVYVLSDSETEEDEPKDDHSDFEDEEE